jgi:hypothetical protein
MEFVIPHCFKTQTIKPKANKNYFQALKRQSLYISKVSGEAVRHEKNGH